MGLAVAMALRVPEEYLSLLIEQLKPDIPSAVSVSLQQTLCHLSVIYDIICVIICQI